MIVEKFETDYGNLENRLGLSDYSLKKYGEQAIKLAENSKALYTAGIADLYNVYEQGLFEKGLEEVNQKRVYQMGNAEEGTLVFLLEKDKDNPEDKKKMQFLKKTPVSLDDSRYEVATMGHIIRKDDQSGKPRYYLYGCIKINEIRENNEAERAERIEFFEYLLEPENTKAYIAGEFDKSPEESRTINNTEKMIQSDMACLKIEDDGCQYLDDILKID